MATVEPVLPDVARIELAAERSLRSRRPIAFASWLFIGGVGTWVDKIHERLGVVAYPNREWVGERLPVSPVYLAATLGFFSLYALFIGLPRGPQSVFGGKPLRAIDFLYAHSAWIAAYVVSGVLGSPERTFGVSPALAAGLLAIWALPTLVRARRTRLPWFALGVAFIGTSFEWLATSRGGFAYPVCPSPACAGATVPLVWLPLLYVHAALYVHRMLGGSHWLRRPGKAGVTGIRR